MSWTYLKQSTRSLVLTFAILTVAATVLYFGAKKNSAESQPVLSEAAVPAATFAADPATLGAIPDSGGTGCGTVGPPRNVTFNVSGLTGAVSNVAVENLTFSPAHTWRGDVTATLIAPNGASHVLFGRTGATTPDGCGSSNDLAGPYSFSDSAAATNWWTVTGTPTPAGAYRTTTIGGSPSGGQVTSMNPAFAGVTDANGIWTLRLTDAGGGDTGGVSAATLNVTAASMPMNPFDANVDMNGDGRTDWVVARGTNTPLAEGAKPTGPNEMSRFGSLRERRQSELKNGRRTDSALAPPIYWYINTNGSGATAVGQLGDAETDFVTPQDFDGDDRDDLAVWTPGAPNTARFTILQSTTNTIRTELFGQTGDDPTVVGDYDGDNKADPAVYRCPELGTGDGQCYFYYRGSNNNPSGAITFVPWGFGEEFDFFANPGDFDGDNKYDFCIQRVRPGTPAGGQFVLLRSSDLGVEYIDWGLANDFIVPGDYDGDRKSDFAVVRNVNGNRQWWILTRTGATSSTTFGLSTDFLTPGDYDADGRTDVSVWRPTGEDGRSYFYVLNSTNSSVQIFQWGLPDDYPVANWYVH